MDEFLTFCQENKGELINLFLPPAWESVRIELFNDPLINEDPFVVIGASGDDRIYLTRERPNEEYLKGQFGTYAEERKVYKMTAIYAFY